MNTAFNPEISTVQPIAEDGNTQVALLDFDDGSRKEPNSYTVEIAETVKSKDANAIFRNGTIPHERASARRHQDRL